MRRRALSEIPRTVQEALTRLRENTASQWYRGRVFVTGGAVRDLRLGRGPADIDIVSRKGVFYTFTDWALSWALGFPTPQGIIFGV